MAPNLSGLLQPGANAPAIGSSNGSVPAPAAPSAAPNIAAPMPSVSANAPAIGQSSGTVPTPDAGPALQSAIQDRATREAAAAQKINNLESTPLLPPDAPHARLFNIVAGIGAALSATGKALATHGKEGGAQDVEDFYAKQQAMKQAQIQQAQQNRDEEIKGILQSEQIAEDHLKTQISLATLPLQLEAEKLNNARTQAETASATTDAAQKAYDLGMTTGDFSQYNSLKGTQGGAPVTGAPPQATQSWKTAVDAANTALPNDPVIAQQVKIANDPNSTPQQLAGAARIASQRAQEMGAALKSVKADDPLAKFETPDGLQAPGAVASLQAIAQDPNTTQANVVRANMLIPKAEAAQKAVLMQHDLETKADQAVRNGDPAAAGALLASGDTTISELKSRGMTPEYVTQAINAAKKIVPNYNAIKADNDAKVAGSEQNNQFFGSANSLVQPGGTLDQLAAIGGKISASDYKLLNKTKNWAYLQTGGGPIAAYASTLVGVADDYSKVMGGGTGSDTSRAMVLKILDPSLSPDQRAAAINAARAAVNSQKSARIGNNSFLQKMYGSTSENPQGQNPNQPKPKDPFFNQ
jgi:hypothetical protein